MDSSVLHVCCRVGDRVSESAARCRGDATGERLHAAGARHKSAPNADRLGRHRRRGLTRRVAALASPEFDPAPVIERVKATFRQPGVVTAALSYYRHTFHPANRDPALQSLQERIGSTPTPVPTLAVHGTRDRPGRLEAFEGMDDLFPKGLEKVVVPGRGPFVHVERPSEVNRRIVAFLQAAGGARGR